MEYIVGEMKVAAVDVDSVAQLTFKLTSIFPLRFPTRRDDSKMYANDVYR